MRCVDGVQASTLVSLELGAARVSSQGRVHVGGCAMEQAGEEGE